MGGENPESFLRSFSSEILEAAFKVSGDRLKKKETDDQNFDFIWVESFREIHKRSKFFEKKQDISSVPPFQAIGK